MIKRILVATDGSDHARKAIDYACDLASKYGAMVYLLHVIHKSGIPKKLLKLIEVHRKVEAEDVLLKEVGNRIITAAKEEAKSEGVKNFQSFLMEGDPAECIIRFAKKENVDIIVLGSRGLSTLDEVLLGSVSHKVCNVAHCTCVTVK